MTSRNVDADFTDHRPRRKRSDVVIAQPDPVKMREIAQDLIALDARSNMLNAMIQQGMSGLTQQSNLMQSGNGAIFVGDGGIAHPGLMKINDENPPIGKMLGVPGVPIYNGVINDPAEYNRDFYWRDAIDQYDQMYRSDAQAHQVVQVMGRPIRRAKWDIEAVSDAPIDQEIASFVRSALFDDMIMTTSDGEEIIQTWDDILRHILTMIPYGFSCLEYVWRRDKDGFTKFACWAPMAARTIWRWWTGGSGELLGIQQFAYKDGQVQLIDIPAKKMIRFTFDQQANNYDGVSALRAAYPHWFYKTQLYAIQAVGHERTSLPIPVIKLPATASADDWAKARIIGENLRANEKMHVTMPEGWEILYLQGTMNGDQLQQTIEHHDRMIARAVGAMFLNLGGERGAFNLDKSQTATFQQAIQAEADYIAERITSSAIRKLVRANYDGVKVYPKLVCSKISAQDLTGLAAMIQQLAGFVNPDPTLEDWIRDEAGLPKAAPVVDPYTIQGDNPSAGDSGGPQDDQQGSNGGGDSGGGSQYKETEDRLNWLLSEAGDAVEMAVDHFLEQEESADSAESVELMAMPHFSGPRPRGGLGGLRGGDQFTRYTTGHKFAGRYPGGKTTRPLNHEAEERQIQRAAKTAVKSRNAAKNAAAARRGIKLPGNEEPVKIVPVKTQAPKAPKARAPRKAAAKPKGIAPIHDLPTGVKDFRTLSLPAIKYHYGQAQLKQILGKLSLKRLHEFAAAAPAREQRRHDETIRSNAQRRKYYPFAAQDRVPDLVKPALAKRLGMKYKAVDKAKLITALVTYARLHIEADDPFHLKQRDDNDSVKLSLGGFRVNEPGAARGGLGGLGHDVLPGGRHALRNPHGQYAGSTAGEHEAASIHEHLAAHLGTAGARATQHVAERSPNEHAQPRSAEHARGLLRAEQLAHNPNINNRVIYGRDAMEAAPLPLRAYTREQQRDMIESGRKLGYNHAEAVARMDAMLADAKAAGSYDHAMNWYHEAHDVARAMQDAHRLPNGQHRFSLEQAVGVLAATSPRNFWTQYSKTTTVDQTRSNNNVANPNLWDAQRALDLTARNAIVHVTEERLQSFVNREDPSRGLSEAQLAEARSYIRPEGHRINDLPVHIAAMTPEMRGYSPRANQEKALQIARLSLHERDAAHVGQILSGLKVNSFYNNIMFPGVREGSVTIDAHMMSSLFRYRAGMKVGEGKTLPANDPRVAWGGKALTAAGKANGGYALMAHAVRVSAAKHGLTPEQAQAIAWVHWRHVSGYDNETPEANFWGPYKQFREAIKANPQAGFDFGYREEFNPALSEQDGEEWTI